MEKYNKNFPTINIELYNKTISAYINDDTFTNSMSQIRVHNAGAERKTHLMFLILSS